MTQKTMFKKTKTHSHEVSNLNLDSLDKVCCPALSSPRWNSMLPCPLLTLTQYAACCPALFSPWHSIQYAALPSPQLDKVCCSALSSPWHSMLPYNLLTLNQYDTLPSPHLEPVYCPALSPYIGTVCCPLPSPHLDTVCSPALSLPWRSMLSCPLPRCSLCRRGTSPSPRTPCRILYDIYIQLCLDRTGIRLDEIQGVH